MDSSLLRHTAMPGARARRPNAMPFALDRRLVLPLPAAIAPQTEADGAAAQLALARLVGATPGAGFKIGATGKRMQEYLGLNGPAAGFMHEANVFREDVVGHTFTAEQALSGAPDAFENRFKVPAILDEG